MLLITWNKVEEEITVYDFLKKLDSQNINAVGYLFRVRFEYESSGNKFMDYTTVLVGDVTTDGYAGYDFKDSSTVLEWSDSLVEDLSTVLYHRFEKAWRRGGA